MRAILLAAVDPEAHYRFRWNHSLLFAGGQSQAGSSRGARARSNESALAAAGQAADQRA